MEIMESSRESTPLSSRKIGNGIQVDIEFQDLTYAITDRHVRGGWRKLLKGVNGVFRSGELTAIMGPSGAGKSTLLNILAGYVSAGVKGTIKINDRPRDMKSFNKISSYIMQDDILQPKLSVKESMVIAAYLKLGPKLTKKEKLATVEEVCKLLGLEKCLETRTEYLSGGQKKRLAIALELVNNPPVIFLDEPTTGLDNFAIRKCMELLHDISKAGRNVICTIHQPPTSLFHTFDQVYVLADGSCVYNGSPTELVPFLSYSEYPCPLSHTPAEYIIELVQEVPDTISILTNISENGKVDLKNKAICPDKKSIQQPYEIYQETTTQISDMSVEFATPFWSQFVILLTRMFVQLSRNKSLLYIQFFHHLLSALLMGGIFYQVGSDGSKVLSAFKFCVCVAVFFMYTYVMTSVIKFPLEVKLIKREYFNRWYSLKAYYLAFTISGLPPLIVLGIMFSVITYVATDQPFEYDRFLLFTLMGLCVGLCSQGLGYFIGAICNILNGSVVGPLILSALLAFAMYGMGYRYTIEPYMKIVLALSYVRFGSNGFCNSIFDKREPLQCFDEYCHYANPEELMKDMGLQGTQYVSQVIAVLIYTVIFRLLAYIALKYRMSSEFSTKIAYYATKIIKSKECS